MKKNMIKIRGHHIRHLHELASNPEFSESIALQEGHITPDDYSYLSHAYQLLIDLIVKPDLQVELIDGGLDELCKYCPRRRESCVIDPTRDYSKDYHTFESQNGTIVVMDGRNVNIDADRKEIEKYGMKVGDVVPASGFITRINLKRSLLNGLNIYGPKVYTSLFKKLDLKFWKE
ncbi:unnamed protein product [marine sediment metagenome]|uniref:Uncharacterized protein n=1 Tax=marine sediment metagenome TaxID=412755 RepID=X0VUS8_9ZZZZ